MIEKTIHFRKITEEKPELCRDIIVASLVESQSTVHYRRWSDTGGLGTWAYWLGHSEYNFYPAKETEVWCYLDDLDLVKKT